MIETHECLWCKQTIGKNLLFCSSDCETHYNKQYKTKKESINWDYIEAKNPGAKTKNRLVMIGTFCGVLFLKHQYDIKIISSGTLAILGLVMLALAFIAVTRITRLK